MRNLTDIQKQFIVDKFFNDGYSGAKSIGEKLVNYGYCIVAGTEPIFISGIGNFIKTEITKDFVDCLRYEFKLEEFLSSHLFKDMKSFYVSNYEMERKQIESKLEKLDNEHIEICKL